MFIIFIYNNFFHFTTIEPLNGKITTNFQIGGRLPLGWEGGLDVPRGDESSSSSELEVDSASAPESDGRRDEAAEIYQWGLRFSGTY